MNCVLTWMSICLIDPSNVYLTAGLYDHQNRQTDGYWARDHYLKGPIAEVRLGTVIELTPKLSIDVGYLHRSFILESSDVGTNGPYASVTWRPFR